MNKLVTLLGLVVASLVIFRFHTGQYNLNDAFKVIDLEDEAENAENGKESDVIIDNVISADESKIYGAVINPKLGDKALKKILAEILNNSYEKTVVVIA